MLNTSTAIARLLDANLNRAREGLRTLEEWCRFGLEDAELTAICKNLRQELARWHQLDLLSARHTPTDVGTGLSHPQEEKRSDIESLLQANFGRVQEALRVLEEYGKLQEPALGKSCKQMRYEVYSLESRLFDPRQRRLAQIRTARLYLVTSPVENLLNQVEACLKAGLTLVQYRDKTAADLDRYETARQLSALCQRYGALFLVNDRPDLALAVGADGIHLGHQDLPLTVARQLLGPHLLLGCSTTNPEEMTKAMAAGADYIGVGPVYATPTKAGKTAAGLDYVHYAQTNARLPWFAIGGIEPSNLDAVLAAGAQQVAVVRALINAPDPFTATQHLLTRLNEQCDRVGKP